MLRRRLRMRARLLCCAGSRLGTLLLRDLHPRLGLALLRGCTGLCLLACLSLLGLMLLDLLALGLLALHLLCPRPLLRLGLGLRLRGLLLLAGSLRCQGLLLLTPTRLRVRLLLGGLLTAPLLLGGLLPHALLRLLLRLLASLLFGQALLRLPLCELLLLLDRMLPRLLLRQLLLRLLECYALLHLLLGDPLLLLLPLGCLLLLLALRRLELGL